MNKLKRDEERGWIGGVCSGLEKYFDIDVTFFRIAFLLGLFFGGSALLIYIALWIAMPKE